jgi:hypothetical protein
MGQVVPGSAGLVVAAVGAGQLEVAVLVAGAVLAVTLLAIKVWFSRDRRLRKAASAGYHQRDLARYTSHGIGRSTEGQPDPRSRPLAPTFVAPAPGHHPARVPDHPDPTPSPRAGSKTSGRSNRSYGTFDPVSNLVRAFDTEAAQNLRPPTPLPHAVVQPTRSRPDAETPQQIPSLEVEEEIPPPAGALPLLVQPPPPVKPEQRSSAG